MEYCGYSAQFLVPHSTGLPPLGIPIYVLWSDSSTDSPAGWYRGNVTAYQCDGLCSLHYDNGDIEPSVDLHSVEWCFALRYRKNYQVDKPVNTMPSASVRAAAAEAKSCFTKVHKAKGFADDLTVISNRADLHQQALTSLVLKFALSFNLPNVYPFILMVIELCQLQNSQYVMVILSTSAVLTVPDF